MPLKKLPDEPKNCRYQQAEQNHGSDGKIKPEVFFFNADIAGQAADPVQLVMKKINEQPDNCHPDADEDDVFSCFSIHAAKLPEAEIDVHSLSFFS